MPTDVQPISLLRVKIAAIGSVLDIVLAMSVESFGAAGAL